NGVFVPLRSGCGRRGGDARRDWRDRRPWSLGGGLAGGVVAALRIESGGSTRLRRSVGNAWAGGARRKLSSGEVREPPRSVRRVETVVRHGDEAQVFPNLRFSEGVARLPLLCDPPLRSPRVAAAGTGGGRSPRSEA